MRIAILGGSGRIGQLLVEEIAKIGDDSLVACYVSQQSSVLGDEVGTDGVRFQSLNERPSEPADLLIDFSTPDATLALLADAPAYSRSLVVGTTGLGDEHTNALHEVAKQMPVVVCANFAESFEPFVRACRSIAASYPEIVPTLSETYHDKKKPVASGTSLRLIDEIIDARAAVGASTPSVPLDINRVAGAVGQHVFRLDTGGSTFEIDFSVTDRRSFAVGALAAGQWVIGQRNGLFVPADILESRLNSANTQM